MIRQVTRAVIQAMPQRLRDCLSYWRAVFLSSLTSARAHPLSTEPRWQEQVRTGREDLTVLIPSRGRRNELEALLRYFEITKLPYKVLVLESGNRYNGIEKRNGLNLELVQFADNIPFSEKLGKGLGELVKSPLVCLATDHDLTTIKGIAESTAFLLANPDYSACHGYHGYFEIEEGAINLMNIAWFTPSIEQDDPLARLSALIRRYQPVCWAVHRTEVMREAVGNFHLAGNFLIGELLWSTAAVLAGKVKRLPIVYCMRRADDIHLMGHPLYILIESLEKFVIDYLPYRKRLVDQLVKAGCGSELALSRQVDLIHACYFYRDLDRGILEFFTDRTLQRDTASIFDDDINSAIRPQPRRRPAFTKSVKTTVRDYRLFPEFIYPEPRNEIFFSTAAVEALIADMDRFPIGMN